MFEFFPLKWSIVNIFVCGGKLYEVAIRIRTVFLVFYILTCKNVSLHGGTDRTDAMSN